MVSTCEGDTSFYGVFFHGHARTFFGHRCLNMYVPNLSTEVVRFVQEGVFLFGFCLVVVVFVSFLWFGLVLFSAFFSGLL